MVLRSFVACASCGCHAKPDEVECPHCGTRLRRADGSVPRTAVALLLGLTTTVAVPLGSGCGDDVERNDSASSGGGGDGGASSVDTSSMIAAYGTAPASVGSGGFGGEGGASAEGGASDGGNAAAYGVPATDGDMDGYIDALEGGDDCDDGDPNVHPGAPDKPGDGIDSDCDGTDE
jgi:hypothetical protein